MPIEIKELHIRLNVGKSNCEIESSTTEEAIKPRQNDHIVQECVERVLEVLKQQNQR